MKQLMMLVCLAGLATLVTASAHAQNGTLNLGSADILQDGNEWFAEARTYKLSGDNVAWEDNITLSLGGRAPINGRSEFSLVYSRARSMGNERDFGLIGGPPDVIETKREVLAPSLKWRFSDPAARTALALVVGADVAITRAVSLNRDTGAWASEDVFTPAARLQAAWGRPGTLQWQLAAQVAAWDSRRENNLAQVVDGFGTVAAVGGGAVWPMSSRLALAGDFMVPVSGDNVLNEDTGVLDDTVVWSAALGWDIRSFSAQRLTVFATNALGPTLGSSIIATPDDTPAMGVSLTLGF